MTASSIHAQLLGPGYGSLPPLLQRVHDGRALKRYAGRCSVRAGRGWLARMVSRIAMLPRACDDGPLTVVIERTGGCETWTRTFGTCRMRSVIRRCPHGLEERLGPVVLTFALIADGKRIVWRLQRARLLLLPLPTRLFAECGATECVTEERYCFDVRAQLVGVGLIVHYQGWLIEHAG